MSAKKQLERDRAKAATLPERKEIRPQPGPQEVFLSSPADIAIYGGAAGSGKSWSILMEPLRHVTTNREFAAVCFRRNLTQVKNPGGLWDESLKLYPYLAGTPISHIYEWKWSGGGKVKFAHLEHEDTVLDWQGSQIPLLLFDELTHFSQSMFFYMLSRNRSMCGVRPYVRATCNPDADSWVAEFISWWIDQDTGYPIYERSGKLRWFIRLYDSIIWADTREELIEKYGPDTEPKSVTFVPAKLEDNQELMKADPGYRANLMAMSRVERERLLHGNWKIRPASGMYFRRSEVTIIDTIPTDVIGWVRRWDLAATEPSESNPDPDWTAGVLMGKRPNGKFVIAHVVRDRIKSAKVRELVKRMAVNDEALFQQVLNRKILVKVVIPQDPGQAGVDQADSYVKELVGHNVKTIRETGDKIVRADPYAAQWQAGNVELVKGPWNEAFLAEHESFGDGVGHDDQVDAGAGAFIELIGNNVDIWSRLN